MSRERILGLFSLLGGLLGILLVTAFSMTGFGYPATAAYRVYEMLNRFTALPLLLMACGWLGLALMLPSGYGRKAARVTFAASFVMTFGTAAEFWLFSDQPYGVWTNGRMASFMAFFIASLILYVGATVIGLYMWRAGTGLRAGAVVLMIAIPLYIVAMITVGSNFIVPALLALVSGWLLLDLSTRNQVSAGMRT